MFNRTFHFKVTSQPSYKKYSFSCFKQDSGMLSLCLSIQEWLITLACNSGLQLWNHCIFPFINNRQWIIYMYIFKQWNKNIWIGEQSICFASSLHLNSFWALIIWIVAVLCLFWLMFIWLVPSGCLMLILTNAHLARA